MHRTDCLWGAKRNGADLGRSMVLILEILSSRASVETSLSCAEGSNGSIASYSNSNSRKELGIVKQPCNSSTKKSEIGRSQVQSQPGLHSKTLSPNNNNNCFDISLVQMELPPSVLYFPHRGVIMDTFRDPEFG